jgi:DnaJ family protein C protein 7
MAASKEDQRSSMDIDSQEPQQQNTANGTEERSPTPPPHRPTAASADEADSFKLAGNKFFKDGNYRRAIEEYNKGMHTNLEDMVSLDSS